MGLSGLSGLSGLRGLITPPPPWWDPAAENLDVWAVYSPKGAASLAASYNDLSDEGNDCGPGNAPTWDSANGWIFAGANYLTTTFQPQNDQSQSCIIQFTNNNINGTRYLWGSYTGSQRAFCQYTDTTNCYHWNGSTVGAAPALAAGCLGLAGNQGYRNGSPDGGAIGAYAGAITHPTYIAALNFQGSAQFHAIIYIQRFILYSSVLTSTQMAAIYTAIAALP